MPDQKSLRSATERQLSTHFSDRELRTGDLAGFGVRHPHWLVQWLPAGTFASGSARVLATVLVATVAVPLALPTFLEIPLAISLLAAGLPTGAAVALLFAGPVINLPSLVATARLAGWKVAASIAGLVWLIAVAGGLLSV